MRDINMESLGRGANRSTEVPHGVASIGAEPVPPEFSEASERDSGCEFAAFLPKENEAPVRPPKHAMNIGPATAPGSDCYGKVSGPPIRRVERAELVG